MAEIYLIRHPATLGGNDLIKGQDDIGLAPGWEPSVDTLALRLAELEPFDAFFSSDLKRARQPAERIVEYLKSRQEKPLEFTCYGECGELLRERNVGVLQGMCKEDVDTNGMKFVNWGFGQETIDGGESKAEMIERAETFATKYLQKYINNGGNVGIMGHGWWINYLINSLMDNPSRRYNEMENLDMVRLIVKSGNVYELLIKNSYDG